MGKQFLDKDGLQVVADKVRNKQDKFEAGTSLELVTVGEGEIDEVLYAGEGNVLTDELPPSARTNITVTDPEKALSIANQLVQVRFFGFIDATMVSITALSPQTSVGAVKGDVVDLKEPKVLLPYTNSVSREYNEWCSAHGVSFNIPWEYNDTLTVYLSSPTLTITKTLNYKPDDTQLSDKSSWSSSHTRDVINSLLPLPFANSDTTTIEESSAPTWSDVDSVERNGETVDTSPTIVDGYLLQKFLWDTTVGATELPQTMQVELNYREIYIGVYGYLISCNGLVIGQTIDAPNEGSAIFENAVGMTWDYWNGGTYTVTFVNLSDCPVQKVNVTNAVDEEAREVAAGAMALSESVSDKATAIEQNLALYNSYSFDEKWTGGTWVDGKKIYKKTYDLGTVPSPSGSSVYCRIPFTVDFDTVVEIKGMIVPNENSTQAQIEYYSIPKPPKVGESTTYNVSLKLKLYNNVLNLELETRSELNNKKAYATVYYTKNN